MKLTESKIKQMIIEESVVVFLKERKIAQAEQLLWESRQKQRLDEKWWKKLLGTWTPTDADIEDEDIEDNLEAVTVDVIKALRQSGKYSRKQAEAIVKKYLSADPDLARVDHKDLTDLFFKMNKTQAAEIENLEAAEDKAEPTAAEAEGEREEEAETETDAPTDTVKGVTDILKDPTQRKMLLKGLLSLFTNDSVESALVALKPAGARNAVLSLVKQIASMEPEVLKTMRGKMEDEIADAMFNDAAGSPRPRGYGANQAAGIEARRQADARFASLGLPEGIKSRANTEKLIILEALNLYIERKLLK